ncbi:2-dehydropantoate 2-reductase [Basidiobolus meristosporus CBS 931.73]|uniref:2-dehydropantoate 2-reductase n=1 Tax=Basidiobolus meristosporus CBS 931.73 TaxID=1314790 RepID=A0A1Y1YT51_9FUNG|nr:2-dehydropantoate 2-reductase [Basidiobolus meristosporus CBS 931.73]|eukprot:ORY01210.1 2-dehydropantoate 2-reductase [Basidiobolus meristosporus CBS 931.73]
MASASRFHILGAGAIGCLLAHHLRQANYPVTLLLRNAESLQKFGLTNSVLITPAHSKDPTSQAIRTTGIDAEALDSRNNSEDIKHLIVTTKTYDTTVAFKSIKDRLNPDSTVTLVQNGMGVYEETIKEFYPEARGVEIPSFILGTTTHGCFRTEPFRVIHAGFGKMLFGAVDTEKRSTPQVNQAMGAFAKLELNVQVDQPYDVLRIKLFEKLVVNACINPLTATLGCKNGALLDDVHTIQLLKDTCHEAFQIIQAEFGNTADSISYRTLEKAVFDVCNATLDNRSSMLQDVSANRRSEIDYINGYLVHLAEKHNLPSPINRMWQQLIKARSRIHAMA